MTDRDIAHVDSPTEQRNPRTRDIDQASTLQILERLNTEDASVAPAIAAILPTLAELVDRSLERFESGGTIHYVGAGTSGRIAAMDAAELPPTYGIEPGRITAHHAGGQPALDGSREGIEDSRSTGRADLDAVATNDVVIGLAASGRTPYVAGALAVAHERGALTALITANPRSPLIPEVDLALVVDTGPEPIAGSTRMKAGTAQKLVLNGFSTALMVRQGKTYSNLMVDVKPSNAKLRGRVLSILTEATGASTERCADRLREAEDDLKVALVSLLAEVPVGPARRALERSAGRVRAALDLLAG